MLPCKVIIFWLAVFNLHGLKGNVKIEKPYHPAQYIRVGHDFNITCNGNSVKLLWSRKTKNGTHKIKPTPDVFEMTWIEKQPSADVQSILVKKNANLTDSGVYTCMDEGENNSYDVTVIALHVWTIFQDTSILDMSCFVGGFSENPPPITHIWSVNGSNISPDTKAYNMTNEGEMMSIQKSYPGLDLITELKDRFAVQEDTGLYECSFIFSTNLNPFRMSQQMYFNASVYPSARGTAASRTRSLWNWTLPIAFLVNSFYR